MITTLTHRGRRIKAEYHGGAYIDLTFGSTVTPIEVINVWDYEAGAAVLPGLTPFSGRSGVEFDTLTHEVVRGGVREVILDWIRDMDKEWPDWYEGYIENARGYR